jgi:hypothetical protein
VVDHREVPHGPAEEAQAEHKRPSRARTNRRNWDAGLDDGLAVFDGFCREVLTTQGREVLASGDPLQAELWVSHLLGLFGERPLLGEPDPAEAVGARLVSVARRRRTPEAQMCLRALAAVGSGELAVRARRALAELGASAAQVPGWLHQIGRAVPTAAWRASDPYGDQDGIIIGFRYPGGREHCLTVLADHLLGGIAKDAVVLPASIEDVLPTWRDDPGIEIVEEPVARAAGRAMKAVEWTSMTIDPPVTGDFVHTVALVRARLGSLADPVPDHEPLEASEREDLVRAFLSDDAGSHLAHDPDAWFLIDALVDYRCDHGGDPLRWSGGAVELFLLDWVPRKLSASDALLGRAGEVLGAWVPWAAVRAGLPAHLGEETLEVVAELGDEAVEALQDRGRWGPAKRVAMEMLADGVDPADGDTVEAWLSERLAGNDRAFAAS